MGIEELQSIRISDTNQPSLVRRLHAPLQSVDEFNDEDLASIISRFNVSNPPSARSSLSMSGTRAPFLFRRMSSFVSSARNSVSLPSPRALFRRKSSYYL